MLILNGDDVRRALPMREAIEAMKQAFSALSAGRATVPQRTHLEISRNAGISLIMPALVDGEQPEDQALTVKVVSLFDGNAARGLARIQAAVLVIDTATGVPQALLEGGTLTAIRTAAASGAATDLLARQDARRLAIFGAGVQARFHVLAMCAARPIDTIAIYSPTATKVQAMIDELSAREDVSAELRPARDPRDAVADADIICTASTSRTPVFDDADLKAGVHINAVGSYQPHVREIPPATVQRARIVVDQRAAAWEEAGDLIQPLHEGLIDKDCVHAELGELVLGRASGRRGSIEITLFKSVGVAVQDALAARTALANAKRMNVGQSMSFS